MKGGGWTYINLNICIYQFEFMHTYICIYVCVCVYAARPRPGQSPLQILLPRPGVEVYVKRKEVDEHTSIWIYVYINLNICIHMYIYVCICRQTTAGSISSSDYSSSSYSDWSTCEKKQRGENTSTCIYVCVNLYVYTVATRPPQDQSLPQTRFLRPREKRGGGWTYTNWIYVQIYICIWIYICIYIYKQVYTYMPPEHRRVNFIFRLLLLFPMLQRISNRGSGRAYIWR